MYVYVPKEKKIKLTNRSYSKIYFQSKPVATYFQSAQRSCRILPNSLPKEVSYDMLHYNKSLLRSVAASTVPVYRL